MTVKDLYYLNGDWDLFTELGISSLTKDYIESRTVGELIYKYQDEEVFCFTKDSITLI